MVKFTVSTFIDRPQQEVFDFATDPANASKWQNGTVSSEWSSNGSVGVGSTLHSVGRLLGREIDMEVEITQWEPPYLWGQRGNSGPIKFDNSNKFEARDGGTLLVQTFEGEIGGFFKMAEGMAIKQLQKQVEADGKTLKGLLEAE